MNEPLTRIYVLPETNLKDIELMSIWVDATNDYADIVTIQGLQSASEWFKSYLDSVIEIKKMELHEQRQDKA